MSTTPISPYCPTCMQWRGHKANCPAANGTAATESTDYSLEAYHAFLRAKTEVAKEHGYTPDIGDINPWLKPHQKTIVQWAVAGGRRAIFAAFGLGKTVCQLETIRLLLDYERRLLCKSTPAKPAPSKAPAVPTRSSSKKRKSSAGTNASVAENCSASVGFSPNLSAEPPASTPTCPPRGLIVAPLGVRQEFRRDAEHLGIDLRFVRTDDEVEQYELFPPDRPVIYLTNYESVRDGKINPAKFTVTSLDEASILRGFGGTKTFREFMRVFETVKYRFVATATPDPNEYIELLAYAAYLGIMDVSQAKTRFFKRDSTKADKLTIHPHKVKEFWTWVATWALFLQKPSELGFSDEGYTIPEFEIVYHEIPVDHSKGAQPERDGQERMFREALHGVTDAAREKRDTLTERVAKMREILDSEPDEHFLLWHDLEAERHAIAKAVPDAVCVWGSMKRRVKQAELDTQEQAIIAFSDGEAKYMAGKPQMLGSGCNFQRHCARAIYVGIGYKFNDFLQSIHRIVRYLQNRKVVIHIIYAESEKRVLELLLAKWERYKAQAKHMSELMQEYGLSQTALIQSLQRALGVERVEVSEPNYRLVNADAIEETRRMETNSVDLILTSVPFSTQYEYSPNYADLGHTDNNEHFWRQMDFLTPELLRVLGPGRLAAIHVKDRIVPGGITGLGFQTVYPFHVDAIRHYMKHGFAFMGMKTIVTDVVRENNQTYRLGWTEQCKDGTKMGYGMEEYLLLFRKPPSDTSDAYADVPVVKQKPMCAKPREGMMGPSTEVDIVPFEKGLPIVPGTGYSRSRWQIDAHGFMRSSGNRPLMPADLEGVPHATIFKLFRKYSLEQVYDYEHHVKLGEILEAKGILPVTFMLLQPQSWSETTWTDITRMRTLNGAQSAKGKEMHLCPMQFDLANRVIVQNTQEGETVYDPFNGLGTVTMCAVKNRRKGIGCELSAAYFADSLTYVRGAAQEVAMPTLFDLMESETEEEPEATL